MGAARVGLALDNRVPSTVAARLLRGAEGGGGLEHGLGSLLTAGSSSCEQNAHKGRSEMSSTPGTS